MPASYRDCYLETMTFGRPERIPLQPGGPRESTLAAWHKQGLAEGANWHSELWRLLELEPLAGGNWGVPVDARMIPQFEEEVLDHRDGHYIVRDWMGAVTEISDCFDYTYIRSAKDFVTRKWHRFPVQNRDDWEAMKERYKLDAPGRFVEDFEARCAAVDRSQLLVSTQINGPFWQMREWCGFEGLCELCIEQPEFVDEMAAFWKDFVLALLERITSLIPIDRLGISEDMAYKAHSMISPAMARRFLLPSWREWTELVMDRGGQVVDMDSDGFVGELIPLWIEAGINVCSPMEVAAHNDIVAFREQFGRKMGYVGGIDKRAIAKGGGIIDAELKRVIPPLLAQGGFLPSCDHGVPSDISWPNFVDYARKLAGLLGWYS